MEFIKAHHPMMERHASRSRLKRATPADLHHLCDELDFEAPFEAPHITNFGPVKGAVDHSNEDQCHCIHLTGRRTGESWVAAAILHALALNA